MRDAIAVPTSENAGPIYGVTLIRDLPVGGMLQAMPSRRDLEQVKAISERTVAGYEVLLSHYVAMKLKAEKLEAALKEIAEYGIGSDRNDGICPYGCDCPNIAQEAIKSR